MKGLTTAYAARAEHIRSGVLAAITEFHQVREADLCEQLNVTRPVLTRHLKALSEAKLIHRVTPMNLVGQRQQVGQVWTAGPDEVHDRGTAEPLQVSTRTWVGHPAVRISMLERLLFPSYGVMA